MPIIQSLEIKWNKNRLNTKIYKTIVKPIMMDASEFMTTKGRRETNNSWEKNNNKNIRISRNW